MAGPEWARQFLATPKPAPAEVYLPGPVTPNGSSTVYGKAALAGEVAKVLAAGKGERNDTLNRSAFKLGQLVNSGHVTEADAVAELRAAAATVGLGATEIAATVRSGMGSGQGFPRTPEEQSRTTVTEVTLDEFAATAESPPEEERERTSWWPRPIGERASEAAETPLPTHLERDDGNHLFYQAKVNGLIGESESGKSWVALLAVKQAVTRGERVLFLDFEDSPASVYGRLESLGLTAEQRDLVDYADPQESLELEQRADLNEALAKHYGLIVADGVNAAMVLMDLDLNSNTDATKFFRRLLRPLARRTGACVITVDHLPKNPDARGKGGIGAQAKRAMTDGCLLTAEVAEPFGRDQSGSVKLSVDKDRGGRVRGISAGGKNAGIMQVVSIGDTVELTIEATVQATTEAGEVVDWRPTRTMELVSRRLETVGKPLSFRSIDQGVEGRITTIKAAIKALYLDGYVAIEDGPRGSNMHSVIRPYREFEADRTTVLPTVSHRTTGNGESDRTTVLPTDPSLQGSGNGGAVTHTADGGAVSSALPPSAPPTLDIPDGWSSCNQCGEPTPDEIIEETAGYCRSCGRRMNP